MQLIYPTVRDWLMDCSILTTGIWCAFLICTITLYLWKFLWIVSFYIYSILFYFLGWGGTSDDVLVGSFCMTSLSNPFKLFFSSLDSAYFSHGFSAPYQTLSTVSQALLLILPSFLTQLNVFFSGSLSSAPLLFCLLLSHRHFQWAPRSLLCIFIP